jgi:hypothetical protein
MTATPLDIDRARLDYVIRHKGKLPGERVYPRIARTEPVVSKPRRWWMFWRKRPEPSTFARALAIHIGNNDPKSALQ